MNIFISLFGGCPRGNVRVSVGAPSPRSSVAPEQQLALSREGDVHSLSLSLSSVIKQRGVSRSVPSGRQPDLPDDNAVDCSFTLSRDERLRKIPSSGSFDRHIDVHFHSSDDECRGARARADLSRRAMEILVHMIYKYIRRERHARIKQHRAKRAARL